MSKGGGSQNQQQSNNYNNQYNNQYGNTSTPNNLSFLQQMWGDISGLFGGTSGDSANLINNGMKQIGSVANYLTPFANGSMMLQTNPDFKNMVSQISNSLQPEIDGSMAASGRYGSGADANAFGSALTNTTGQLAYQNYQQGMQDRLAADQMLQDNGQAQISAGQSPYNDMASILAMLGPGGGKNFGSGSGTGSGSGYGQSSGSYSNYGLNFGQGAGGASGIMGLLSLFGL